MATYGEKASDKVESAMHERKRGELKSGGSGKTVTSRKQAIAIGLSEARKEGAKVPAKKAAAKKSAPAKKAAPARKSTAAKKAAPAKKAVAKKTPVARKSTAAKKAPAKRTAAKKAAS
jgi:phage/plasmid-associated DNA primase